MNLIIDIRCLTQKQRTGVGEYCYEFLDALFEADTKNQYFLFYNSFKDVSGVVPKWTQENVHYIVTRWPSKFLNALIWLRVIKLDLLIQKRIEKKQKNIVTIKQYNNITIDYFFAPNINFINLSKNIKLILTIHDLSFEFFRECFSWKRRIWHRLVQSKKLCMRAQHILTPSKHTRQDVMMEYGIHGDKVTCIYPGLASLFVNHDHTTTVDTKHVQQKYDLPDQYILYLGTLEPRKNVDLILDAYERLNARDRYVPLVIAGGRGWKYREIIARIDHMANVYYIGYVNTQDKIALYDMARVFVFPSLYEGFGFPVLEAMSRGVPVITTNRASLPEVVENRVYMLSSHDVMALSQGIHRVLNSSELCVIMRNNAKKRSTLFRWDRAVDEFLLLIKK